MNKLIDIKNSSKIDIEIKKVDLNEKKDLIVDWEKLCEGINKDIDAIFSGIHQSASLRTSLRSITSNQHALAFGDAIPMPIIFKVRNYGQTFYKEIGAGEEPLFSPEDAGI